MQNLSSHDRIGLEQREVLNGHRAFVLWLTGLPASGKSTLAYALETELFLKGLRCVVLDGDDLREGLCNDLSFSPQDRAENIRRVGHVARLMVEAGLIVLTSFVSPYRRDREQVRRLFPPQRFYEIYLDCSVEVCERRDPKGNYRKAREGTLMEFTGVSAPYEIPLVPDLVVCTGETTVQESLAVLLQFVLDHTKIDSYDASAS
jgi:adenylylsulfate kinase